MSQVESIDDEQILACFDQAMGQAFESFFFSEAVRRSDDLRISFSDEDYLEVELVFRGPFSGHLHLRTSRSTARNLVLSLPLPVGEICDNVIADLFAELTNTVGGRIVAALAGNDFEFDLTIPKVTLTPNTQQEKGLSRIYDTDFGIVALAVTHLREHKLTNKIGA